MKDCIFCKIVAGEIPANKVFENDDFMAIVDIHPLAPGQLQVIPKKHYRWVWDVPNIGPYFEVVQTLAKALQRAFGIDRIQSKVVGEDVPHAHVWLFPDPVLVRGDKSDFVGNAEKIHAALGQN